MKKIILALVLAACNSAADNAAWNDEVSKFAGKFLKADSWNCVYQYQTEQPAYRCTALSKEGPVAFACTTDGKCWLTFQSK